MIKVRKPPTRIAFCRVGPVEVLGKRLVFELRKSGVVVHEKNKRRKNDWSIGFDALASGGGYGFESDGASYRLWFSAEGLKVKRSGVRKPMTVPYSVLANVAKEQPELFV